MTPTAASVDYDAVTAEAVAAYGPHFTELFGSPYSAWLVAMEPYERDALAHLVDAGGEWTPGEALFPYPNSAGIRPHGALRVLVRRGLAQQTGDDTWTVTLRGRCLDTGRPEGYHATLWGVK